MHMGGTLAPGNIRWQPELGGGTVADIGCYLINVARWAGGTEPVQVTAVWQETAQAASTAGWDCCWAFREPWWPLCSAHSTPCSCVTRYWPAPAAAESARTGRTVHLDRIRDQVGSEQFELALVAAHLAEVAAADGEHRLRDRTNLALDVVLVVDPVCPLGGRLRAFHGDHVFDYAAPG